MKLKTVLATAVIAVSFMSCGWKASEEEIKVMEETRTAALKAEETVSKKESELKAKKAKTAKAKASADKAQAELDRVMKELEDKKN